MSQKLRTVAILRSAWIVLSLSALLYCQYVFDGKPNSDSEEVLVILMQWKLTRIEVAEKSIVTQEAAAKIQIALAIAVPLGRSYAKAQRELERLQNPGAGNPPSSSHRAQRVSDGPHPERGDPDPLDDSHASPDPQDPDPQNG